MSQAVKFEIKGLKETLKNLKELEPKVQKKVVRKALREGTKIVAAEMKGEAPVETGQLKRSIKIKAGKRKKNSLSVKVETDKENFPDQYYSAFVEFGTSKQPAQHFMENAFKSKEDEARARMVEALKEGIEKEAKSTK